MGFRVLIDKKRIYQFIGFSEEQVTEFSKRFIPNKGLIVNDKFNIQIESHDTVEIIKLRKHRAMEYEH